MYATLVGVAHGVDVAVDAVSVTVVLPDGSNVVGRLVVVHIVKDGDTGVAWPAGWSVLEGGSGAFSMETSTRYRVIDGTEGFDGVGDSIVCSGAAEQWAAYAWLFENAAAPEAAVTTGVATVADPPALAPAGGSGDYHWLVMCGWNGSNAVTGYPPGYAANQHSDVTSAGVGNVTHARCSKQASAASDDPGLFTVPAGGWRAVTIAVGYAAGARRALLGVGV